MAARATAAGEEQVDFDGIVDEANRRLRGEEEIVGAAPDELRDRLLAGFEYVLVDEYQDIDGAQYELITHIARRSGEDGEDRATILAVGDDDQTIYEWRRANVEFLHRFEEEYGAERHYLAENYRSTRNIVEAAEALILHNRDRMKTGHPIRVDARRAEDPPGGDWESLDRDGRGRVSVLEVSDVFDEPYAVLCGDRTAARPRSETGLAGLRGACLDARGAGGRAGGPREGRGSDPLGAAAQEPARADPHPRVLPPSRLPG